MALLEVRNLTKSFGGVAAVRGLDFDVCEGEIVSIIGPNGAGKSTTFDLITGYQRPTKGSVRFKGQELVGLKPHEICHKGIGRTFQIVKPFPDMTVRENVLVAAINRPSAGHTQEYIEEILEITGLGKMKERRAKQLTLAARKRLEVARAVATGPSLLLMDEVFAGLNPTEVRETIGLIAKLKEKGLSAATGIEHVMKVVMAISDRIIVLNYGEKIAEGTPKEIASDVRVVKAYLGE